MTDKNSSPIDSIFRNLDSWRNLPNFRLEPHVATFLSLYVRTLLEKHLRVKTHETLIPEFPLRKGTLDSQIDKDKRQRNRSYKVDYVAFKKEGDVVYLVELKTDMKTKRNSPTQPKYLRDAKHVGYGEILEGVTHLAKVTKERQKYAHLCNLLFRSPYPPKKDRLNDLLALAFEREITRKVTWCEAVDNLGLRDLVKDNCVRIEIVYIQPDPEDKQEKYTIIDFDKASTIIGEGDGAFDKMLACYLREWKRCVAGSRRPT